MTEASLAEASRKIKALEDERDTLKAERDKLSANLNAEKVGGFFSRSKLIAERAAIPADVIQARFESSFKIEDGKIIGYDQAGKKLYSRSRPGEIADFDEALETLIARHPAKDQILQSGSARPAGSSVRPGAGSNGSRKIITRAEFDRLDPVAQGKAAYGKDAMTIVD